MELFSGLLTADDSVWFALPNLKAGGDLLNPFNGNPVEWQIRSPDSADMVAFQRSIDQKRLNKVASLAKRGDTTLDAGEIYDEALQRALAATVGWRNLPDKDGNDVAFSPENAKSILSNPQSRWITDWVDGMARDRGNFFGLAPEPAGSKAPSPKK